MEGIRICSGQYSVCSHKELPLTDQYFYFDKRRGTFDFTCVECRRKVSKIYNDSIIGKDRDYRRRGYKIKGNQFTELNRNSLLKEQKYRCAICENFLTEERKGTHIDHNHNTNEVRGLLCNNCNHLIGNSKESVDILNKAIIYLNSNKNNGKNLF